MNRDKVEGILIGIGVGIVLAALLHASEQRREKAMGGGPAEVFSHEEASAPLDQNALASRA